jgi:anti-sigma28 factor (negative regulator of flagellin synthesis)
MAEVVNSLFGITPESLQARRDAALQQQALQYAQLDPFQRATAGIYSGANRLGGAIGGMLGAQDPELQRITQRQSLLQQAQPTNAKGWSDLGSQLMQAGDIQGAQEAYAKSQTLEAAALAARKTESEITKNTAEQKAASTPADIAKAQRIAAIKAAIPAYKAAGDTQTTKLLEDELTALLPVTPVDKGPSYGAETERISKAKYNKTYDKLTQTEAAEVDKEVERRDLASRKAGKTDVVLPGVKTAGDVTGLRRDLQALTKPYQDQADAANDAIDLANMAIKSNNFAAVSSLSRSLAKAAGETQLSRNDVEAFGIDPSLVGSVSDTISRLAQSRPTVDTLTKLRQLAQAIQKKAESRISIEEQQLQATARVSGQFTEPQIETVFRRRPKEAAGTAKGTTKTTRSGVKYTVENN